MQQATPEVSIVLPTHNGARFIRQSIDSVLAQTCSSLELLVVDDCSTDATAEIVASYDDLRVRFLHQEINRGLPESLNVGFRAATGSYLTWTSDDNWYAETALERMLDCLKTNDHIGLVYAGSHLVDEAGAVTDTRTPRQLEDFASNPWNPVGACFLYRRQAYERVGEYDPVQRLVEDYDYWLRIADCFETAVIPDLLYYYRQHSSSLSAQYSLLASEKALRLLRSRGDLSDAAYRYWMSWLHQDAAYAAWKLAHSRRRAFRAVVRSMIFQPSSIIQRTLAYTLVWSILGDRLYEQLWRAKQQFVPHR